ncbi:MAG: HAD-IA family hydrolase [Flavobacteriaceae bacterium]|nr:HAD-IA family hydrolase [Flavobacteriaceae bacterium]
MIKNIIFDFGDVFINLNKQVIHGNLNQYNADELPASFKTWCQEYEIGALSTAQFLDKINTLFPEITTADFIDIWNEILLDFPKHRMDFLKEMNTNYRCFMLSNTNEMHLNWIINDWGEALFQEFKNCFEVFYLSHEIGMRKPIQEIFEFVLNENNLIASETLFIDDTQENTDAASKLGIHVWTIDPKLEDVSELPTVKKELFL